jgi:MFS family permease
MALMTYFAQSYPELLVYRFLDGWAAQMWLLGRLASISHHASPDQRGRQVSWMYSMDTVGRLAGPLVGGIIAVGWGSRSPFVAYALLALVALIPSLRMTEDTPARPSTSKEGGAPARSMNLAEIIMPRLAFFGVAFFSAIARGPIFADVFHLYAAFAYNLDAAAIGILAALASGIGLPIGFLAGWLMDRYGRKVTMVPGFLGVAITMVLIALTSVFNLSVGWYVAAFLLAVTAQSLTGGSIQTIGADVAPANARGMFLGLWRFTAQVGTTLSPLLFAWLAEATGYGSAFIFIAGAAFVTVILLVTHIPESARHRNLSVPASASR